MAKSTTTTAVILLFTIIAALSAITTTARPCKTIFFITTFNNNPQNPNPNPQNPNHLTFFITEIHQFHRHSHHSRPIFPDQLPQNHVKTVGVDSSVKDRTIDIMSIVGSLLFGVGCGAFTAAVMYSIWYFCSGRIDEEEDEFDSDEEEFGDVEGGVKNGEYVAVANAEKEVPPTADEVDAMKK